MPTRHGSPAALCPRVRTSPPASTRKSLKPSASIACAAASTAKPFAMPDRSARTSGRDLVTVPAGASSASIRWPTRAPSARRSPSASTRCRLLGPKPQASTTGATVTSKAPPDAALTRCAVASTARVSAETANGVGAACRLKRASSESAR